MASCLFFYETEMGMTEPPAPPLNQLGFTKIFFNDFKMPFKNVHHFWIKVEASTKNGSHFCTTYLDFELIQTYLNWSYLNAIYILDAPKNVGSCYGSLE